MLDDDDDRYLYGDSEDIEEVTKPQPISLEHTQASTNGVVAHLEAQVKEEPAAPADEKEASKSPDESRPSEGGEEEEEEEEQEGEEEEEEEEDSEDDVEIIMELPTRSLDFRQRTATNRQGTSTATPTRPPPQQAPTLTTEYTPRERNAAPKPTPSVATSTSVPPEQKPSELTDGVDTKLLPVATAPPSHPSIDPNVVGTLDGRSILEVDLNALAEKPWRRPGSDISDWFNYGFDEISWEAYCHRRREVGELAAMLKANVLNFAGMPEEQLAALPPEIRTMVMAGASAMMSSGSAGPGAAGMLPAAMNMSGPMMNPMMDMGGMMPMMHEMDAVSMAMASQGMQGMGMPMGPGMGPGMGGQGMGQDMSGQGMGGQMGGQGMGQQMGGQGMGQQMGGQGMGGQGMGGQGMGGQGMGGQGMPGQGMGGQGMGGQGMGGQGMGGQMGGQGMGGQGMGGQGMVNQVMGQVMGSGPGMSGQNGALSGGVAIGSGGPSQTQGRATPEQPRGISGGEGFNGNAPGQGMVGMGGEFPMQQQEMPQPIYPGSEGSGTPAQGVTPTRNVTPGQFRGRPMQQNVSMRGGRGIGYPMRGGRSGPVVPIRPASPLPPNVPTGPRNKNKYKDIDGSAPAVEGLDYGGGKERNTPPDHDDRSSRKRRSSPGLDDSRSSKRR